MIKNRNWANSFRFKGVPSTSTSKPPLIDSNVSDKKDLSEEMESGLSKENEEKMEIDEILPSLGASVLIAGHYLYFRSNFCLSKVQAKHTVFSFHSSIQKSFFLNQNLLVLYNIGKRGI